MSLNYKKIITFILFFHYIVLGILGLVQLSFRKRTKNFQKSLIRNLYTISLICIFIMFPNYHLALTDKFESGIKTNHVISMINGFWERLRNFSLLVVYGSQFYHSERLRYLMNNLFSFLDINEILIHEKNIIVLNIRTLMLDILMTWGAISHISNITSSGSIQSFEDFMVIFLAIYPMIINLFLQNGTICITSMFICLFNSIDRRIARIGCEINAANKTRNQLINRFCDLSDELDHLSILYKKNSKLCGLLMQITAIPLIFYHFSTLILILLQVNLEHLKYVLVQLYLNFIFTAIHRFFSFNPSTY